MCLQTIFSFAFQVNQVLQIVRDTFGHVDHHSIIQFEKVECMHLSECGIPKIATNQRC